MSEYGHRTTRCNVNTAFVVLFALVLLLVLPLASTYAAPPSITLSKRSAGDAWVSLAWTTNFYTGVLSYTLDYGIQGSNASWSRDLRTKYTTVFGLSPGTEYWFRVTANMSAGEPVVSDVLLVTTTGGTKPPPPPAAPTSLVTTSVAADKVSLQWTDNSTNETGFAVERAVAQAGPYTKIGTTGVGIRVFTSTGLAESSTYYFRVYAYNASGNSAYSNTVSAMTPATIPAAPGNAVAVPISPTQVSLRWSDNSFNETEFCVMRATSPDETFHSVATLAAGTTSYTDDGLVESSTYYYRIYSANSAGNSLSYASASATTPASLPTGPSGLSATPISSSRIDLKWSDMSFNETGFSVERASNAGGPFSQIATVGAGVTSYSNTGLAASTTYFYRVCAVNSAGSSAYAGPASATTLATIPTAPSGLSATAISSTRIDLRWSDNSSNETGFVVQRGSASSGPFTQIGTTVAGTTSYSDSGLTGSTTYYYRVCATNSAGNSAYAGPASATTQAPPPVPPSAPQGLAVSVVSSTELKLTWQYSAGDETGFKVERATSAGGPFTQVAAPGAGTTSYSDTGLTASTTYYYRVCTYNSAGSSAYAGPVNATTLAEAPAAPGSPSATAISSSRIDVKWTDNSSNESGFKIERASSAGGPYTQVANAAAGATSYSDTGLSASTTYHYRVCAYNAVGNSSYAGPVNATTLTDPPAAPSNLVPTAVSTSRVDLKWTDNSSNETGFRVERSTSANGPFTQIAAPGAGTTSYSDTGLTASTTYYYRVCAYNSAGSSAYAGPASATTSAEAPAAPSNLSAVAVSSDRIDLTWIDNSSNETSFTIERSSAAAGPFAPVAMASAGATSYSDAGSGVNEDTTYYYRVCAVNGAGQSGYTPVASAITKLNAPANLTATAVSSTSVSLTWTDRSAHEANYVIERSFDGNDGTWGPLATLPANSTSYTDQTCQPLTSYYYRVYATGSISDMSNTASATTPGKPLELEWIGKTPVVGEAYWVAMSGNYAYVTSSTGLQVVDLSDPSKPLVKGSVDMTYPYDVATDGNGYVYVGAGQSLQVVDVREPALPMVVATLPMPDYAQGVYLSGSRAYVACYMAGMAVVDITNPESPRMLGVTDTPGFATSVAVTGSTAVVADNSGVVTIDVSNPMSPAVLGSMATSDRALDVAVDKGYAYVAASTAGLLAVDLSNPSSPRVTGAGAPTQYGYVSGVAVSNGHAYASTVSYLSTNNGLQVFDLSAPSSPMQTGFTPILGGRTRGGIAVDGSVAVLATGTGGITTLDLTNPDTPVLLDSMSQTMQSRSLIATGSYLYGLSYSSTTSRLYVFDTAADPAAPPQIGSVVLECPYDMALGENGYLYVADGRSLKVVDVQNPENPAVVATVPMPDYAQGVCISGGKAYVACYTAGLVIVDITNPLAPVEKGRVDTPGVAFSVAVSGNIAVVADTSAVVTVNVSNPAAPGIIGSAATSDRAVDVAIGNGYAYVAASTAGLLAVDLSNPSSPQIVGAGAPTLYGYVSGVTLYKGRAFAATLSYLSTFNGLQVFDLTNPRVPTDAAFVASPGYYCRSVAVTDGYAYLTDERNLAQVYGF